MKLNFEYNKEKDIWCLLNYGKPKVNTGQETQAYSKLVVYAGSHNSTLENSCGDFIDAYIAKHHIDISGKVTAYENAWKQIEEEYHKRAEEFFGIQLSKDVTAYLTINTRCPYSIEESMFFISMNSNSLVKTAMHELWHFYTWEVYGQEEMERIGAEKYNEAKESLTVLLNILCTDLLEEGVTDRGYENHKEIRERILKLYRGGKDFKTIWEEITT